MHMELSCTHFVFTWLLAQNSMIHSSQFMMIHDILTEMSCNFWPIATIVSNAPDVIGRAISWFVKKKVKSKFNLIQFKSEYDYQIRKIRAFEDHFDEIIITDDFSSIAITYKTKAVVFNHLFDKTSFNLYFQIRSEETWILNSFSSQGEMSSYILTFNEMNRSFRLYK